jgi:hypothetical protein
MRRWPPATARTSLDHQLLAKREAGSLERRHHARSLGLEYAAQDQRAGRGDDAPVAGREGEVGMGEQIGQYEREGRDIGKRFEAFHADLDARVAAVARGIDPRRGHRVGIDVEPEHGGNAELDGGHGKDARADADVEGPRGAGSPTIRSRSSRQPSVLPWWPVPKARPGSITTDTRPAASAVSTAA